MAKKKSLDLDNIALILVLLGGLNIGLMAVGVSDLLAMIPGMVGTIVNILIGLSAVLIAYKTFVK